MIWQDFVLTFVSLVFFVGLVPSVLRGVVMPAATAVPTASAMIVMAFTQVTLNLYLTALLGFLSAVMWGVLAARSLRLNRKGGTLPAVKNPVNVLTRRLRERRLRQLDARIDALEELTYEIDYDIWPEYVEELDAELSLLRAQREATINQLKESN